MCKAKHWVSHHLLFHLVLEQSLHEFVLIFLAFFPPTLDQFPLFRPYLLTNQHSRFDRWTLQLSEWRRWAAKAVRSTQRCSSRFALLFVCIRETAAAFMAWWCWRGYSLGNGEQLRPPACFRRKLTNSIRTDSQKASHLPGELWFNPSSNHLRCSNKGTWGWFHHTSTWRLKDPRFNVWVWAVRFSLSVCLLEG